MLTTGVIVEIVIIVTVAGKVVESVIATQRGTVIVTEIVTVIAETVKGAIRTERDGQKEMAA